MDGRWILDHSGVITVVLSCIREMDEETDEDGDGHRDRRSEIYPTMRPDNADTGY